MATDSSSGRVVLMASANTWTFDGSSFQRVGSAAGTGSVAQSAGELWFPDPGRLFDFGLNSLTSPPQTQSGSSPCAGAASCPKQVSVTTAREWTGTAWAPVDGTIQPPFAASFGAMSSSVAPAAADLADGEVVTIDGDGVTRVASNPVEGWQVAAPATALGNRAGAAMAYDPATGLVLLFGGTTGTGAAPPQLSASTWSWDGEAWSTVATER
jgi:hypothetical protein